MSSWTHQPSANSLRLGGGNYNPKASDRRARRYACDRCRGQKLRCDRGYGAGTNSPCKRCAKAHVTNCVTSTSARVGRRVSAPHNQGPIMPGFDPDNYDISVGTPPTGSGDPLQGIQPEKAGYGGLWRWNEGDSIPTASAYIAFRLLRRHLNEWGWPGIRRKAHSKSYIANNVGRFEEEKSKKIGRSECRIIQATQLHSFWSESNGWRNISNSKFRWNHR